MGCGILGVKVGGRNGEKELEGEGARGKRKRKKENKEERKEKKRKTAPKIDFRLQRMRFLSRRVGKLNYPDFLSNRRNFIYFIGCFEF